MYFLTAAKVLNGVQLALDVVGLIPGAGEVADGVNALISLARGDKVGAAISAAAMIPLAGAAATGGKLIKKGVQALGSVVAPVVKNAVKNVVPAVASSAKKVISTVASVSAPIAKKAISTAATAVKKAVSTATTAVKNTAAAVISSVKNAASSFVSGVKGLVGGLFKKSAPAPASSKIDLQLFGNKATKGAGNAVPNPNGKKGGTLHQNKIGEVANDIRDRGLRPDFEYKYDTTGGSKNTRYADVVALDSKGRVAEIHQVGKSTKKYGSPVSRERQAIKDIRGAKDYNGARIKYHPYDR